eukprot:s772_g16.t1
MAIPQEVKAEIAKYINDAKSGNKLVSSVSSIVELLERHQLAWHGGQVSDHGHRHDQLQVYPHSGRRSRSHVALCGKLQEKTVIFTVFAQLECKPEWAEPMVRAKVQYTATGLDLKSDGWLFPASGRLYLRALEEYVLQEMDLQRLGGPHVELIFLGRGHEMISKQSPLWDPKAKVAKPKMRVWGKKSPPECALLSKVRKD